MESIILASSSPRRKELLKQINIPFESIAPGINENIGKNSPEQLVSALAQQKVEAVLDKTPAFVSKLILGADTIVYHKGRILGKPIDIMEAREYLAQLAGDTHQVITGLALYSPKNGIDIKVSFSKVTFCTMAPDEIDWYLSTREWEGAAGGYRIQERGGLFVIRITGSCSNVVGLPIHTLYGMLRAAKYQFNAT